MDTANTSTPSPQKDGLAIALLGMVVLTKIVHPRVCPGMAGRWYARYPPKARGTFSGSRLSCRRMMSLFSPLASAIKRWCLFLIPCIFQDVNCCCVGDIFVSPRAAFSSSIFAVAGVVPGGSVGVVSRWCCVSSWRWLVGAVVLVSWSCVNPVCC